MVQATMRTVSIEQNVEFLKTTIVLSVVELDVCVYSSVKRCPSTSTASALQDLKNNNQLYNYYIKILYNGLLFLRVLICFYRIKQ